MGGWCNAACFYARRSFVVVWCASALKLGGREAVGSYGVLCLAAQRTGKLPRGQHVGQLRRVLELSSCGHAVCL